MPRVLVALTAFAGLALLLGGCDPQENADTQRGRMLFQEKCGTCHALAEAGTSSEIGPDLDAAFAAARESGQDQDTIEGVVSSQVENPKPFPPDEVDVYMPAELVTGQDLADVSTYVGSVAGIPGIKPPKLPPAELFAQQCGICHTLAAAGSTSTTGPDLDQSLQGKDAAFIMESIVEPDKVIAPGFGPGIMPSTFSQTLTENDLQGLTDYMLQSVNGGGK